MNKRLILGIVGIVLFLGVAVIAPLSVDRERTLTDKEAELAEARGIDNYTYQDYTTEDTFQRCLQSLSDFRLPCSPDFQSYTIECTLWNETILLNNGETQSTTHAEEDLTFPDIFNENETFNILIDCITSERVNFSDRRMEISMDEWENAFMTGLFAIEDQRETQSNKTLIREGIVTSVR